MGIKQVRTFCQLESIYNYKDGKFVYNPKYGANLHNYLDLAEKNQISVICVIGNGNYEGAPKDLDGNLRWELIQNEAGLKVYHEAYKDYANRFKTHKNIIFWETNNEPYSSLTWSPRAKELGVIKDQVHNYLRSSYLAIKPIAGSTPVGFSDLEEEEQVQYQTYSSVENREKYVDDCTDIYAMHIYRNYASQVFDFSKLNAKPKWVLELGAYNYLDPQAIDHEIAGNHELYNTDLNYQAVVAISQKLVDSGFTLVMPWGFSSNGGMVEHNPDGSHTLKKLPLYLMNQLER